MDILFTYRCQILKIPSNFIKLYVSFTSCSFKKIFLGPPSFTAAECMDYGCLAHLNNSLFGLQTILLKFYMLSPINPLVGST